MAAAKRVEAADEVRERIVCDGDRLEIEQQRCRPLVARCVASGDLGFDLRPDRFAALSHRVEMPAAHPFF